MGLLKGMIFGATEVIQLVDNLNRIKEIFLDHRGPDNAISSGQVADMLGVEPGASKIKIRELIRDAMVLHKLPLGSNNRGYYLITDEEDLRRYSRSLEKRMREIEDRKARVLVYFNDFYGFTPTLEEEDSGEG